MNKTYVFPHFYFSFQIAVAFTDLHSLETQYLGLQRALFLTAFVCALGGFLFLMVTLYLVKAKNDVHRAIQGTFYFYYYHCIILFHAIYL